MTAPKQQRSGLLSIGAVLAQLRGEFPDLSISKIRYLETEELITPNRTPAGYRQFSQADVARLRYILAAQRDHYLPLKVIKEQLDAAARGVAPTVSLPPVPRALVLAEDPLAQIAASAQMRLTRAELLDEVDLTAEQLEQSEEAGLLAPGVDGYYDAETVLAAQTIAQLFAAGLEPRHLRPLRARADREAEMVMQLVAAQAQQRNPDARQRASEAAANHVADLMRLHAILVKTTIARELRS